MFVVEVSTIYLITFKMLNYLFCKALCQMFLLRFNGGTLLLNWYSTSRGQSEHLCLSCYPVLVLVGNFPYGLGLVVWIYSASVQGLYYLFFRLGWPGPGWKLDSQDSEATLRSAFVFPLVV